MKIEKKTIETIANGKTSFDEEVQNIAKTIIERGLFEDFTDYIKTFGDGDMESVAECLLEYSWNGAKITVDVSDTNFPGGSLNFYGITPDASFQTMMEAIDDNPEIMELLSGKKFRVRGSETEYMLVEEDDQRMITRVD